MPVASRPEDEARRWTLNLSDQLYLLLGLALGLPMAVVALFNWLFRHRGGFARGWAGAIFVGLCWATGMVLILSRVAR